MVQTIDIITIIISVLALISSVCVGIKQVKISKTQVDVQNKVELFLNVGVNNGIPAVLIRNIGNNVIYLEKYIFNGQERPLGKYVLPPVSTYDWYRYIELPTNGIDFVSLRIEFEDWDGQKWQTTGNVSYGEGEWKVAYNPSERTQKKCFWQRWMKWLS